MKKRFFALMMALVLATSLIPVGAMATEGETPPPALTPEEIQNNLQAEKQIKAAETEYLYFQYDERSGEYVIDDGSVESVIENTSKDNVPVVTTEKTISPTGIENQFDINLTVTSTQVVEEVFVDTAVVLVFDVSGSMDYCLDCKKYYYKTNDDCANHYDVKNTPLYAAKEAAKTFLYSYAGFTGGNYSEFDGDCYTNPNAKRYVSVVTFDADGMKKDTLSDTVARYVQLIPGQQWVDLHQVDQAKSAETLAEAYKTIDGLETGENTNVDAGLYLAEKLLDELNGTDAPKIDYKSVILLCDGEPNAWLDAPSGSGYDLPDYSDETKYTEATRKLFEGRTTKKLDGVDVPNLSYANPAKRAMHIRNEEDAKFYSVAFGVSDRAESWMESYSDIKVNANDLTNLVNAFKLLQEEIKNGATTWYVEDQLGEYVKYIELNGTYPTGAVQVKDNKIHWDLTKMSAEEPYTLSYRIILDTDKLVKGDAIGDYVATSAKTKLHYTMTSTKNDETIYINENGNEVGLKDAILQMDFVSPAVKGYAADLSFVKYKEDGTTPLSGAKFKLEHTGSLCSDLIDIKAKTDVSSEEGAVSFADLPSGHTYTLTETAAPSGYQKVGAMDVAVNYGEVTAEDVKGGLKNELTKLTVKKAVRGPVDEDAVYTITITGPAEANGDYAAGADTVTFTEGKATIELNANKAVTILGLPNGTYKLSEEGTSAENVNIPNHKWTVDPGEATISNNVATATITNVYTDWDDVTLSIPVEKTITLSGKASAAPANTVFTFQMKDDAGEVVDTASWQNVDEDTLIATPVAEADKTLDVTLTDVGTYTFTVSEVDDAASSRWTYDDTVYTVTVTVEEAVVDIRPLSRSEDLPKLAITSCTITKPAEPVEGDQGEAPAEPQPQPVEKASFVNDYYRGGSTPNIPDNPPPLNKVDHYGYIIGYPKDYETGERTEDQTRMPVMPEGNITRAEVATIFFRMLTDEGRADVWSQTSSYSDVEADDWFNNAICTLSNAGIITGYNDGTFRPNANITRAEFATIASRFFDATYEGEDLFPDIDGHWAADYINNAANNGIIQGYPDGTFGPNKKITRAEAVTMVNRTLDRAPDKDHFLPDMLVWVDNMDTEKWYYADMQEATNSHTYDMVPKSDGTVYEKWTKMLPIRDWAELEREWSDANSAPGGDVV